MRNYGTQTFFIAAGLACLTFAGSAQELACKCDSNRELKAARIDDRDAIQFVPHGGMTGGGAFRIVCPAQRREILFHTSEQLKVEFKSAPIHLTVYLKGKGAGSVGFLSVDRKKMCFYPPQTSRNFTLDSPDKWQKIEFVYTPTAGSLYCAEIVLVTPCIRALGGSDFLLDDFELKFKKKPVGIEVEP